MVGIEGRTLAEQLNVRADVKISTRAELVHELAVVPAEFYAVIGELSAARRALNQAKRDLRIYEGESDLKSRRQLTIGNWAPSDKQVDRAIQATVRWRELDERFSSAQEYTKSLEDLRELLLIKKEMLQSIGGQLRGDE